MRVVIESTGDSIPMDKMGIVTYRTDLIPIPANLEMVVKLDDELEKHLVERSILLVGETETPLIIVKVMGLNTQIVVDDKRVKMVSIIAVLAGCESMIDPLNKAVILNNTSFAGAYRAIGCKLKFNKDLPLSSFVSAYGSLATVEVATCLQQEAAMIYLEKNKLSVQRLIKFFEQEPVLTLDNGAIAWLKNPKVEQRKIPNFVSVGEDGLVISGNQKANTPTKYYADADARQLKNLNSVLVVRGTATRTMNMTVNAGDVVLVDEKKYLILTAAHFTKTGALGGGTASASRYWLATMSN